MLGLINFAHGEVFMCGGFAAVFLTCTDLGATGHPIKIWGVKLLIPRGHRIAGVRECLGGLPVWNKSPTGRYGERNAPKLAYLISAIGASYFLQTLAGKEFGYGPEHLSPAQVFPRGSGPCSSSARRRSNTIQVGPAWSSARPDVRRRLTRIVRSTRLGRGHPRRRPGLRDLGAHGR